MHSRNLVYFKYELIKQVCLEIKNNLSSEVDSSFILSEVIVSMLKVNEIYNEAPEEFIDNARKLLKKSGQSVPEEAISYYGRIFNSYIETVCCVYDQVVIDYQYEKYGKTIYKNMMDIIKITTETRS